jgi:hypothetical protein
MSKEGGKYSKNQREKFLYIKTKFSSKIHFIYTHDLLGFKTYAALTIHVILGATEL